MNISEVKLRIVNTLNSLIDTYFRTDILNERFINSTLKIIVKQNISKLDDVLILFSDKDGEIDLNMMVDEYANMFSENGILFDIRKYINNDFIRNMIPDKVLIIKKEDIMSLLN
jgi:hypothetical protein